MKPKPKNITRIFVEGTLIDKALSKAVRDALRQHKQAGNPVVDWGSGKAVWIAPKDIQLWDEE